jgi:glycosyltransferase involved in cell wall biosynthesis
MPTHVCLLHNYREQRQMSMKLYADRLGEALAARGVRVAHLRPGTVFPDGWLGNWALLKFDSYLGRFGYYPCEARKARADIFHIADHGQAYLVGDVDPARTVVTVHDVIPLLIEAGRLKAGFRPWVAIRVFRHSLRQISKVAAIVAVSEQTRRDLAELGGIDPARVRVIPNGLNYPFSPDPAAREAVRRRLRLGDEPLALHVGHTGFYKNIEGLLQIVARARAIGLPLKLLRAGQRMRAPQMALAASLGLSDYVLDLGRQSDKALADLYCAADVLVHPSVYEGFGWPPLEAMASGLPVVCSLAGSLPEVVGDAAVSHAPDDLAGMADSVARVLSDPSLRATLRERGLSRAGLFSWSAVAEKVEEVYRKVLG